MNGIEQLIFVGLNSGYVAAIDRDAGEVVWYCSDLRRGPTTLLLDGDRLIVSTNGYLYCLDPMTGGILWENAMNGYGLGVADLTSVRGRRLSAAVSSAASEADDDRKT